MTDDKEEKQRYVVRSVAVETKPVIVDTEEKPEKQVKEVHDLLAEIANDLKEIKKTLVQ